MGRSTAVLIESGNNDDQPLTRPFARGFMNRRFRFFTTIAVALICAMFFVSVPSLAQRISPRSTALDQADSRAEQEAEQMVALSADKIITILRQEPGLLLEVKKVLVRKAYEQGRLLDSVDLTDDAIFQLLREDQNVRVLATQQIEDRNYIRAKPTREEIARDLGARETPPPESSPTGQGSVEADYWTKRAASEAEQRSLRSSQQPSQQPSYAVPVQQQPQYVPAPQAPQSVPADSRRSLERAETQYPDRDYYEGAPPDATNMSRIQPEDLPGLLNTSANANESARAFSGGIRAGNPQGLSSATQFPNSGALGIGADEQTQQQNWSSWQQASLTNGRYPQMPAYSPRSIPAQPLLMHRANPYADVPSLYDLYSQYSRSPVPQRFGQEIFRTGTGNFEKLPMDLPAGPDYVVGPGDGLSIELWGGVSERLQRTVDREGKLALPEAGAVQVSGRTLGDVQHLVQSVLRNQYRDVEADVSLARIRTVRVYVTGDVLRPGAYDVSSLSTPLNAVFLAGGPTSQGSLRTI